MDKVSALQMLKSYHQRGFNLIPLKPRAKTPLVKWKKYRLSNEDLLRFLNQGTNWAIRCDESFHALDFDDPETYERFIRGNNGLFSGAPVVRSGRGYHLWFKPKSAVRSFSQDGIEVKGLGNIIVIPPSIHPSGAEYRFEKPLNGGLPEVDIHALFGTRTLDSPFPIHQCSKTPILPAATKEQQEFRNLFARLGVYPGENPAWCPFHPDQEGQPGHTPHKSISIDWDRCVFKCHSPRCGEGGGIGRLRVLLGEGSEDCQSYSMQGNTKTNSDIPAPEPPPWDTWSTAEPPKQRCGMPIHLRHRVQKNRQRIIGVLCGRWDCATCGPYLKETWLNHLTLHIMTSDSVQLSIVSREDWPKVYRRINRAGGEFARIELHDGPFAVFTTVNEGIPLPRSLRSGILKTAIEAATFQHKAITTSRGWKLPEEKETDSEWERVSGLPSTVDDARQVVKQLGLDTIPIRPTSSIQDGFEVMLPGSWLEDGERGFKAFAQWLAHGPVRTKWKRSAGSTEIDEGGGDPPGASRGGDGMNT